MLFNTAIRSSSVYDLQSSILTLKHEQFNASNILSTKQMDLLRNFFVENVTLPDNIHHTNWGFK